MYRHIIGLYTLHSTMGHCSRCYAVKIIFSFPSRDDVRTENTEYTNGILRAIEFVLSRKSNKSVFEVVIFVNIKTFKKTFFAFLLFDNKMSKIIIEIIKAVCIAFS